MVTTLPSADRTIGRVASAHRSTTLPDMFNRHRTLPERTPGAPARDDGQVVAVHGRADGLAFDRAAVRARLVASASIGLRDRLAQPALAAQR